ncbi:RING-H2 finger protein ATL79-like isoform X2 [Panicum virgatum]|nr:RING-H2 finger protein ATL79-like isoform X2 [Panicum virgatum]XP_039787830.1 RING-H2 finger protein ATL79-like isoform X2 [Panicum virgatum]
MAMAPQGQEQHHEHEQPHGQRPVPTTRPAAPGRTIATNRWGPYSGAGDFASNMAVILAALLAALALALALNAAVRYLLRRGRRARRAAAAGGAAGAHEDPEKAAVEAPPPPPALVYSAAGTKLAGAAAECAICLAEFADGDAVRVMPACGHGFHARCIERWLAGGRRSSCPTCRAPLAATAEIGATTAQAEAAASPSS